MLEGWTDQGMGRQVVDCRMSWVVAISIVVVAVGMMMFVVVIVMVVEANMANVGDVSLCLVKMEPLTEASLDNPSF